MNPREMSGLEVFQAMRDGKLPHPSMADTINLSRSLGVSEASLRDAEGTLLAHATATCANVRLPPG